MKQSKLAKKLTELKASYPKPKKERLTHALNEKGEIHHKATRLDYRSKLALKDLKAKQAVTSSLAETTSDVVEAAKADDSVAEAEASATSAEAEAEVATEAAGEAAIAETSIEASDSSTEEIALVEAAAEEAAADANAAETAADVADAEASLAESSDSAYEAAAAAEAAALEEEFAEISATQAEIEAETVKEAVSAAVEEDPHFTGFDGSTYDFQGKPDKVYNVITDEDFHLNARFVQSEKDQNTYMGVIGVRVKKHLLLISPVQIKIDDKVVKPGTYQLDSEDLVGNEGSVIVSDDSVTIGTTGFTATIKIMKKHGIAYLNLECSVQSDHLHNPHGLLGQSSRYLLTGRTPSPVHLSHKNKFAAGFIEGVPEDYEIADGLFGTVFTFNRFGVVTSPRKGRRTRRRARQGPRFAIGRATHVPKASSTIDL